jgi:hypothetical protein
MPEESKKDQQIIYVQFWFLLSDIEQNALINYQKKHYPHRMFVPPGSEPNLLPFDADREMKQTPNPSREAMK